MKEPDQNELLQRGELPADPEDGAGPPVPLPILDAAEARRAPLTWAERVRAAGEVMARRASGEIKAMATPWPGVNAKLRGGFWPGAYSLTSSTGTGKTQWAIQCALHLAERFKREHEAAPVPSPEGPDCVLYVALELGDVDLVARTFGVWAAEYVAELRASGIRDDEIRDTGLAGLKWSDLFFGVHPDTCEPGPERIAVLRAAEALFAERLAALPLHVETPPTRGWGCAALEALVKQHRPRFVVLDYAQLMSAPEGAREELRQTIGNVAKSARDLARKPGGPAVLILSSTARMHYGKVDGTGERKPGEGKAVPLGEGLAERLADMGKESGDLEFTVDCALVLARETEVEGQDFRDRATWLAVAKGRGFRTGWAKMRWDGNRFEDWPEGHAAAELGINIEKKAPPKGKGGKRGNGAHVPDRTEGDT